MGDSGSHPHLRPMSVVCTTINNHRRGLRVPTLVLHNHRFCRLACLSLVHWTTSTAVSHSSNKGTTLPNLNRQWATVRVQREYHITSVLPHARGRLLLPLK